MHKRPRAFIYKDLLQFNEYRFKIFKSGRIASNLKKMYSGENDFLFRMKLSEITNISKLFIHYTYECYYNGFSTPNFITHFPQKRHIKNHKRSLGDKISMLHNKCSVRSKIRDATNITEDCNFSGISHSPSGLAYIEELRK